LPVRELYGLRWGGRRDLCARSVELADRTKKQNGLQRYVNETSGELRKVSWPTWPEARQLTILVIIVMVVIGLFLSLVDWGANHLLNFVLGI
jgi:preprotein translocase subunit SecE